MYFNAFCEETETGVLMLWTGIICKSSTMHKFREKSVETNAVNTDVITNWLWLWWRKLVLSSSCKCSKDTTVHIGLFLFLNNN